jgi:hypothetical protein
MITSVNNVAEHVAATGACVSEDVLYVSLADGRSISVPLARLEWLQWLRNATPEQQSQWSLEPGGYAIYWDELDDGVEVRHLLSVQPLA